MLHIAILETGPGLSTYLRAALPPALQDCISIQTNESLSAPIDLLLLSPDLPQEAAQAPPPCRTLLLPGRLAPLAGSVDTGAAVSYGLGPKDTLTLAALGDRDVSLTLQRDVVTLTGRRLDRQDLTVPRGDESPLYTLAAAGLQLLLGVPPESLTAQ